MNINKNKLNSKINWFFKLELNAHIGFVWIEFIFVETENIVVK